MKIEVDIAKELDSDCGVGIFFRPATWECIYYDRGGATDSVYRPFSFFNAESNWMRSRKL